MINYQSFEQPPNIITLENNRKRNKTERLTTTSDFNDHIIKHQNTYNFKDTCLKLETLTITIKTLMDIGEAS